MRFASFLFSALLLPASSFAGLSSIWRHSSKIKRDGFLTDSFAVQGIATSMAVRQVPGDGNCLFHAISACLDHACNGTHPSLDLNELMPKSALLRKVAVDYLVDNLKNSLYLEKEETVPVYELLSVVAAQYNMTAEHYCEVMRQSSVWGGGPEIVALSNALCRPIHVYELASNGVSFCFRRMACFGSPMFDEKQAIHILSADSRFPNLKPGRQLANGNHFLALFPYPVGMDALSSPAFDVDGGVHHNNPHLRGTGVVAEAVTVSAAGGRNPGKFRRFLSNVLTCSCLRRRRNSSSADITSESNIQIPRSNAGAMMEGISADVGGGASGVSPSPWEEAIGGKGLSGIPGVDAGGLQGLGGGETISGTRGGGAGFAQIGRVSLAAKGGHKGMELLVRKQVDARDVSATPLTRDGSWRGAGIGWTRFR